MQFSTWRSLIWIAAFPSRGGIAKQRQPPIRGHQTEWVSGLLPVVVINAMIPMLSIALDQQRRNAGFRSVAPDPALLG
jgi:hypothetical protein